VGFYPDITTVNKMTAAKNNSQANQASQNDAIEKSLHLALAYIRNQQKDGWWPYSKGHGPSTEATAWCALAVMAAAEKSSLPATETINYLLQTQNKDGGWSTDPEIKISEWSSSPALLALRMLPSHNDKSAGEIAKAIDRAFAFLFEMRTDYWRPVARLFVLLSKGTEGLNYGRGWPWTRDTAHWVEPTSYALLALKLPQLPEKASLREAAKHANLYFQEHACRKGQGQPPCGWNHGSNYCLEVFLPPYTVTTAEALLALQDDAHNDSVAGGLQHLLQNNDDSNSAMALAWSTLALHAYDRQYSKKLMGLVEQQKADGSFGPNNLVTAIATLALAAGQGRNLLKFARARN
jgi:Squalene-hopene cyclase C-terminal domain